MEGRSLKSAYFTEEEVDMLEQLKKHSGFNTSDLLVLGVRLMFNSKVWPEKTCVSLRDEVITALAEKDFTLKDWALYYQFPLGSVNNVLNRLTQGDENIGRRPNGQARAIVSALEDLLDKPLSDYSTRTGAPL